MAAGAQLPDLRQQSGPHVFVTDLDQAFLDADDRHHLERSLRLRSGDALTASDGNGRWRSFRFGDDLEVDGPIYEPAPMPWALHLAIALTKGAKPELAVQKATELGIDHVVVFAADHSVARWQGDKIDRGVQRLRRVVREAAMQSRQLRVPEVTFVERIGDLADGGFARADFGGGDVDASCRAIAIGPEGGWSEREREELPTSVDLGTSVLRAETAAIAAATRMGAVRSSHYLS